MKPRFLLFVLSWAAAGLSRLACAGAQTVAAVSEPPLPVRTQVIELKKGWNAVWLEVEPLEVDADKVFAGSPVDVCARFFRPVTSVEFIRDPGEKSFNQEGWGVWYAPSREDAIVKTLDRVNGHAAYLIHATGPHRWAVSGAVSHKALEWKHGAFTLTGFSVDEANPPTFADYFAGADGQIGGQIFRLVEGKWQRIPATSPMRAGEACWILASGDSHYQGPLTVDLDVPVLDFGSSVNTIGLTHINRSPSAHTVVAEVVPAESSASGAGGLPLERRNVDIPTLTAKAAPVTGALPDLESGYSDVLRLAVRRDLMTAPQQTALIKLTDGNGALVWVPVRASK